MCGIIGYIGSSNAVEIVIEGLRHLEYRGYDSAGVAYFNGTGFDIQKCKGKIRDLESILSVRTVESGLAIGHTRWATHGVPSGYNAHPHESEMVVLVHNGIIENYLELKHELTESGYRFNSETDTEVLCHLIDFYHREHPLEEAVMKAAGDVRGSYAIVCLSKKEPHKLVGARKDSPLVLGFGESGYFIASDVPAFLRHTNRVAFLDDGDIVVIEKNDYRVFNLSGQSIDKDVELVPWSPSMADKGEYKHFMLKEIHEQPRSLADTLRGRILHNEAVVNIAEFGMDSNTLCSFKRVIITACGTSWHAALTGKFMIEQLAGVPVEVDLASEFRYRRPLIGEGDLFVAITQSGETADTLAAQREAKRLGAKTLSICNVLGSTSAREADYVFYTHSGPEIGVASTKAFTSQLVSLYLLALALAEKRQMLERARLRDMLSDLMLLPEKVERILTAEEGIREIAKRYFKARDFLYLARGILYPIALEGALKLKEISYIHAEGYPAGEMKHGPIALIDEELPVVILMQEGYLKEKIISNIEEVKSRGGRVILIKSVPGEFRVDDSFDIPQTNHYLEPVLMSVPLQLLAYHIGVLRGCDVDQPRNLAKSVTVE
ncbi:MAG TPA: glutamine--fructose-6-phosphate transaminase (isomerizing) [Nitrospirae bacterium]|nr:glutamine--fructose-6-phosphate transaminase (isomerizing) [Nitrospirota bacterium]